MCNGVWQNAGQRATALRKQTRKITHRTHELAITATRKETVVPRVHDSHLLLEFMGIINRVLALGPGEAGSNNADEIGIGGNQSMSLKSEMLWQPNICLLLSAVVL